MDSAMQGMQFHSYLLNKLVSSRNNPNLNTLQRSLKRTFENTTLVEHVRETFGLFAKLSGPEPFAHMCALALALTEQPFTWPLQYRIDSEMIVRIPDTVASMLYELGRLVKAFPKLSYLNVTIDEYLERKLAIQMFFNDLQYKTLHDFWRSIGTVVDDPIPSCKAALSITPELCVTVRENVMVLVRKLFKDMMLEQLDGTASQTFPDIVFGGPHQAFLTDVKNMARGTVMVELMAHNSTQKAGREIAASKKKCMPDVDEEKSVTLEQSVPVQKTDVVDILRDFQIADIDIAVFLLRSMGCSKYVADAVPEMDAEHEELLADNAMK